MLEKMPGLTIIVRGCAEDTANVHEIHTVAETMEKSCRRASLIMTHLNEKNAKIPQKRLDKRDI
jgi:hypothetical protein